VILPTALNNAQSSGGGAGDSLSGTDLELIKAVVWQANLHNINGVASNIVKNLPPFIAESRDA